MALDIPEHRSGSQPYKPDLSQSTWDSIYSSALIRQSSSPSPIDSEFLLIDEIAILDMVSTADDASKGLNLDESLKSCKSKAPGETVDLPPDIAKLIAKLQDSDDKVDKAIAVAIEKMFLRDTADSDEHKEQDAKTISDLLGKNTEPLDKPTILALLTSVDYRGARHAILELNSQGKAPETVKLISQWLKSEKDLRLADSFAFLLSSESPEHKKLQKDLIEMFEKNPASRNEAISFLKAPFPMTLDRVASMIELTRMGSDKEIAAVKKLLNSEKPEDVETAAALLDLFGQDCRVFSRCIDELAGSQRDRIAGIVRGFASADFVERLIDLAKNPASLKAVDVIIANPNACSEVLLLACSGHGPDQAMSKKLFELLGGDAQQRKDAIDLLTVEFDKRQMLIDLLNKPDTSAGVRKFFEMRDGANRRDRVFAADLMDFITVGSAARYSPVFRLLGADKELALTLLSTREDAELFGQCTRMTDSKDSRDNAMALLKLAGSPGNGMEAAKIIAALRQDDAVYARVLSEIGSSTPAEVADLAKLIARIENLSSVRILMKMRLDPTKRLTADQLSKDILSDSAADQKRAQKLLAAISGTDNQDAYRLIEMRKDAKTKALADVILNAELPNTRFAAVEKAKQLSGSIRLLKKLNEPNDTGLKPDLSRIAEYDPKLAEAVLLRLPDWEVIRRFVDIYNDPKNATAATVLRFMLLDNNQSAEQLLMMFDGNPAEKKHAGEILAMLNISKDGALNPKNAINSPHLVVFDEPKERLNARNLLSCKFTLETMLNLKADLIGGNENKSLVAQKILKLAVDNPAIRSNLERLYGDLSSKDELVRKGAEEFSKLLEEDPKAATELLQVDTTRGEPIWALLSEVADTPQRMKGFLKLCRMINEPPRQREIGDESEPPQLSISASQILSMIEGRGGTSSDAIFVIDMLANPATTDKAIRLLEIASRGLDKGTYRLVRMMNKLEKGTPAEISLAKTLDEMLSNPTGENIRGLENLCFLACSEFRQPFDYTSVQAETRERLLDPKRRDAMLTLLKTLPSSRACVGMMKIEQDPRYPEARKSLNAMVFSKNPVEAARAVAFAEEAAFSSKDFPEEVEWLLKLLNTAETREFAQGLLAAGDSSVVRSAEKMYSNAKQKAMLHDFVKISRENTRNRDRMSIVLDQSPEEMSTIHSLLQNQVTRDFGFQLIDLFQEEDGAQMFRLLLLGLNRQKPLPLDYAQSLVNRYRATEDARERRLLRSLASTDAKLAQEIETKINSPGMETAREFILELSSFASLASLEELEQTDPAKAREAWRMMNDSRYRSNTFRLLGFNRR